MNAPKGQSTDLNALQPRAFRGLNWQGFYTLIRREVGRFMTVYTQTIIAPVITTLLFYTVFALAFGGIARTVGSVPFLQFLAPGLIMMTMVQNAFANTSSSMVISKVQGNIVDVLMPPLSPLEIYGGYVIGAVSRGMCIGIVTTLVISIFVPLQIANPLLAITFGFLGSMMLGSLGLAAGIWSEKFDHIAAITNFIVTPLTFLSGTFYSIRSLPEVWHALALYNPFFYMIDGFRAAFIGQADSHIGLGLTFMVVINIGLMALCLQMLRKGYKLKS